MINSLWKWYNNLDGANRFIVFLIMMTPFYLSLFSTSHLVLSLGVIYLGILMISKVATSNQKPQNNNMMNTGGGGSGLLLNVPAPPVPESTKEPVKEDAKK